MNKLAPPARWYAPWRTQALAPMDPADLGTAFGLDLSLQDPGPAERPAAADRPHGWVQRWAARRRARA